MSSWLDDRYDSFEWLWEPSVKICPMASLLVCRIEYVWWGHEFGSHGSSAKNHFDFCKRVNIIPIRPNSSVRRNHIPMNHSVVSDSDKKCCPSCSDPKDAGMTGSEAEPIKTIETWYRMKKTEDNFITTFSSASLRQSWWCDEASWDAVSPPRQVESAWHRLRELESHSWLRLQGCGEKFRITKCSTKFLWRIYEGFKLTDLAIEHDWVFWAGGVAVELFGLSFCHPISH